MNILVLGVFLERRNQIHHCADEEQQLDGDVKLIHAVPKPVSITS